MKVSRLVILISFVFIISCSPEKVSFSQYTSENDTLLLKTEKVKGWGLFSDGAGPLIFKDTTEQYFYPLLFPKDIENLKLATLTIDPKPFTFESYKNGEINESDYLQLVQEMNIDTSNIPSLSQRDNSIHVMSGIKENTRIFIVDENNNKDFRDDSIRTYQKMVWFDTQNLIKCKYKIFNGLELIEDSSWLNIGTFVGHDLMYFVSHHLKSSFSINNLNYQVGVISRNSVFCFDNPLIALISQNHNPKDTLYEQDLLTIGECLKLNKNYYRFTNLTNDGSYITLVKESNFENEIGTQVGMIAPDFSCTTVAGDTINSSKLHDKFIVIVNSCGCGGDKESTAAFFDIKNEYGERIYALRLDTKIENFPENFDGWHIDMFDDYNRQIYNIYRGEYCSRMCYVIDLNNKIVAKFETHDWQSYLCNYVKKK